MTSRPNEPGAAASGEAAQNDGGLFAKKPMDALLAEAQEAGQHSLKRTLGPFQLTALGVGAVIGAGIFVLSGLGAHYAGPALMLSFVLSGLGCAFAAAALIRMLTPRSARFSPGSSGGT
jgi:amino acid permease